MNLLGDDDGEEVSLSFGKNQGYAERFERRHRKKELAQLRAKHGKDAGESDSESSEDEDAELLTPALDAKILSTIDKIRNKKPEVYEQKNGWFEGEEDDDDDSGSEDDGSSAEDEDGDEADASGERTSKAAVAAEGKGRKRTTLRDQLLEHGAEAFVSDSEGEDSVRPAAKVRAYDAEQKALRQEFLQQAKTAGEDAEDSGLLRRREKLSNESAVRI